MDQIEAIAVKYLTKGLLPADKDNVIKYLQLLALFAGVASLIFIAGVLVGCAITQ